MNTPENPAPINQFDEPPPQESLPHARVIATAIGCMLGLFIIVYASAELGPLPNGLSKPAAITGGVAVLMATLWIFEFVPVAAASLLPLVLFPLLGVVPAGQTAANYADNIVMLFMGAFFLAKGLERWGVPAVLARRIARLSGGSPHKLVLGMMGATALLSMWMSNTATALVMITVGFASVLHAREVEAQRPAAVHNFTVALLIGIAYSSSVGGILTPISTPPNLIMLGILREQLGEEFRIGFLTWMLMTVPIVLLLLPVIALVLMKWAYPFPGDLRIGNDASSEPATLSTGGKRALGVFGAVALLWITRESLDIGGVHIPGWQEIAGLRGVHDSTAAMAGALLMFIMPATSLRERAEQSVFERKKAFLSERLLDWEMAKTIPWQTLLLFGGGVALAQAFAASGLSEWLGGLLRVMGGMPLVLLVLVIALGMNLLTEVMSNTAATSLLVPVLVALALSLGIPPILLAFPATITASASFILPVGTPPNAIAAGVGGITVAQMARVGIPVSIASVVVTTVVTMYWMRWVLGI